MKKNFLQDVVPASQKRSIRDIPLPGHKKTRVYSSTKKTISPKIEDPITIEHHEIENNNSNIQTPFYKSTDSVFEPEYLNKDQEFNKIPLQKKDDINTPIKNSGSSFFKKITITVFSLLIIVITGFIFTKANATVTINPKKTTADINMSIPIDSTNPIVTKTQIVKNVSKTVSSTSEQQVEKQSSGRIKISNTYKQTPQELVKNTRFKSQNNLIYRIKDSITVPGYTMNGSQIVPGTLEVEVFADSAGEEYNISKANFTIPGFEGKEQFEKIKAETVTEISGGYIGLRKVVSQEVKDQVEEELRSDLKKQIEQTQNESTEYIIIPDMSTIAFGDIQDKTEGDSVILSVSASLDAYSFVKKDLFNFIGQKSIVNSSQKDQFSIETENLKFSVDGKDIKIEGSTIATWITDIEKLKSDLLDKTKSEANSVFDGYTSFKETSFELNPFWKNKFPSDISKIEVVISE